MIVKKFKKKFWNVLSKIIIFEKNPVKGGIPIILIIKIKNIRIIKGLFLFIKLSK